MNGATALHTRAACDNCGEMPATREGPGGTVLCDGCGAAKPANDDTQAASCALPLCARCQETPAFFRLKDGDLCSACFAISISVASAPQGANVTAAASKALAPASAAVVTPPSKPREALAWLLAPLRRSSDLPQGGSPVTVGRLVPAPAVTPILDLEIDALVSGLEVRWLLDRRNSSTLRVVAASEMAPKSGSANPTPST
jgi:hypothetical protein